MVPVKSCGKGIPQRSQRLRKGLENRLSFLKEVKKTNLLSEPNPGQVVVAVSTDGRKAVGADDTTPNGACGMKGMTPKKNPDFRQKLFSFMTRSGFKILLTIVIHSIVSCCYLTIMNFLVRT